MIKKQFILLFSLLALSSILFFYPKTAEAQNAILYFSPAAKTIVQGETFWLDIMVNTKNDSVNAVAANFSYPEDKLEPLSVNVADSAMTIWVEKNAKNGKVEIAGGEPTPGFLGIKKIASIGFKVRVNSGNITLKFSEDSMVLRDSDNKNVLNLSDSGQGNYSFKPKIISPPAPAKTPSLTAGIPPVISNSGVIDITEKSAVIYWKTDRDSDSTVDYGPTKNYGFTVSDSKLSKEHSLTVLELTPNTTYHFSARSRTGDDQTAKTENSSFSTKPILEEKSMEKTEGEEVSQKNASSFRIILIASFLGLCLFLILKGFNLLISKFLNKSQRP